MGRVKEIVVKVIPSSLANDFVKKHHYSGKVVQNSNLHFGVFLDNNIHGVMSFGPSTSKGRMLGLVKNAKWNDFIELNRMAFDDYLPKNSESRSIAIAIRLIKKHAPQIKWIVSYSDGTQSGDGTIYRASGFQLTQINKNQSMVKLPDGTITHKMNFALRCSPTIAKKYNPKNLSADKIMKQIGATLLEGFQLRYIYLIDKTCELNVPVIPFNKIDEVGATMYRGNKPTLKEVNATD